MVTFLVSFFVARAWSLFISNAIYIDGYHIHHFYFGMMALTAGGLASLLGRGKRALQIASVLMGVGMGLFADEIGLLLNCTTTSRLCAYAFPDTFDIIGIITVMFVLLLISVGFFESYNSRKKLLKKIEGSELISVDK